MHARTAVHRIDHQPRIIGQDHLSAQITDRLCLDNGILFKGRSVLFNIRCDPCFFHRDDLDVTALEHLPDLAHFILISRCHDQFHYLFLVNAFKHTLQLDDSCVRSQNVPVLLI